MSSILATGQAVQAELSGMTCVVQSLLGAGGQGEVYSARLGGTDLALKWYYEEAATADQRAALDTLVRKGTPSDLFLWPIDLVTAAGLRGFGYLMPLRPSNFRSGNDLVKRRVEPSFRSLVTAGFNLANGFLQLHAKGLAYRDISFGNVFLDADNGNVRICDLDNVGIDGHPHNEIAGTMRFMAPEIVRGEAFPSARTDLYSLAVLLHFMFLMCHPLEGRKEALIGCIDHLDQRELYGFKPVYIADPKDKSNRPVRGFHDNMVIFWPIYPRYFREYFVRAFGEGLHDPASRVKESEWRAVMIQLRDCLFFCGSCGAENFWPGKPSGPGPQCWKCKNTLKGPLVLDIGKQQVVLNHDTRIYPHHVDVQRLYDFTEPVAVVTQHPSDRTIWGLMNLGTAPWTATKVNGEAVEIVHGRSITLALGTWIRIGDVEAKVEWAAG